MKHTILIPSADLQLDYCRCAKCGRIACKHYECPKVCLKCLKSKKKGE
jgi:hypothetical protein